MRAPHRAEIVPLAILSVLPACAVTQPDNLPPAVSITEPGNDAAFVVGDVVQVAADASDSDGVIRCVEFFVDGHAIGQDSVRPYSVSWNTAGETRFRHHLRAEAVDDDAARGAHSVTVATSWAYETPEEANDGWATASLESVGMSKAPFVALMDILRDHENHRTHGILIARHGQLVFEQYFAGYRRDDQNTLVRFDRNVVHDLASATKSVTSALLGIAIDRGFIGGVTQPIAECFPEFDFLETGPKSAITLEHMITMSSGLTWDQHSVPPLDPRNDLVVFALSGESWFMYLSRGLAAIPGTRMNYSEASINVVGECTRRSSGRQLDLFADEVLFGPLGISVRSWNVKCGGWVWASGDLFLRPRDMLKLGQLYLQRGMWEGERVVPEEWVERAARPYFVFDSTSSEHERYWASTADMYGYGYAWWTLQAESYGEGAFAANGWGEQRIMVLPEWDLVAVFTGGSQWEPPLLTAHQMMIDYVLPSIR
jgi:CubicO group peptidase (beta-lactamase class C family)